MSNLLNQLSAFTDQFVDESEAASNLHTYLPSHEAKNRFGIVGPSTITDILKEAAVYLAYLHRTYKISPSDVFSNNNLTNEEISAFRSFCIDPDEDVEDE